MRSHPPGVSVILRSLVAAHALASHRRTGGGRRVLYGFGGVSGRSGRGRFLLHCGAGGKNHGASRNNRKQENQSFHSISLIVTIPIRSKSRGRMA